MPRLLIVDDEPSIRSLLWLAFVRAGYEVKTAADAFKAMEMCGSQPFDAMLSDVEMPGMDGHCLVRWAAATHPNIRTVLMSGGSAHCEECPFVDHCVLLPKPFPAAAAVTAVAQALSRTAN